MVVKIDTLKCTGCGACTYYCPVEALEIIDMKCTVKEGCIDCGKCIGACSWEAITPGKKKEKKK